MRTSGRLVILEGPDGGGKTTLAKKYEDQGYCYIHFGPMTHVKKSLARIYIEAMLPALLGYKNVVMDRSWLSEPIYGKVFRNGEDRLHPSDYRMLERIAMRCGAEVKLCLPGLEACLESFRSRRGEEYLEKEEQLTRVYSLYELVKTSLPAMRYSYTKGDTGMRLDTKGMHPLAAQSAGNLDASVLLVGDTFAEHKEHDSFWQFPFVSFSGAGCSRWLTSELERCGINERKLCWVNSDDPGLPRITEIWQQGHKDKSVIALGEVAYERVDQLGLPCTVYKVNHPQYAKRFKSKTEYELNNLLRELEV